MIGLLLVSRRFPRAPSPLDSITKLTRGEQSDENQSPLEIHVTLARTRAGCLDSETMPCTPETLNVLRQHDYSLSK
jgi:hypothetical protein